MEARATIEDPVTSREYLDNRIARLVPAGAVLVRADFWPTTGELIVKFKKETRDAHV